MANMKTIIDHDKILTGQSINMGSWYDVDGTLLGPVPYKEVEMEEVTHEEGKVDLGKIAAEYNAMITEKEKPFVYRPPSFFDDSKHSDDPISPTPEKWDVIEKMVFPENRWRIQDLIPQEGFVIIAGISGEKKSWLALEMARCITQEITFVGKFDTKGGNVLYIDSEMPKSELQRRGKQLGLGNSKHELFFLNQNDLNFNDPMEYSMDWLDQYVKHQKISVIFVDTFRAVAGGLKEEKAEEVRMFMNRFKPYKDKGVAVVFLDHYRKPNNFEGRIPKKEHLFGSQDKTASVEVLLMLKSEESKDQIAVYQRKNRLGPEIKEFNISMTDEMVGSERRTYLKYAGEIEEDQVKKEGAKKFIIKLLEGGGKTTNEVMQIITNDTDIEVGQKNIRTALRELEDAGTIYSIRKGRMKFYYLPTTAKTDDPDNF
jgi:hypothetical protein